MKILNEKYNDLGLLNIKFKNAEPYPHVILDNFLDKFFFDTLDVDKIKVNKTMGTNFHTDYEKNKWASKNVELSKNISLIVSELYKREFINNLDLITALDMPLSKVNLSLLQSGEAPNLLIWFTIFFADSSFHFHISSINIFFPKSFLFKFLFFFKLLSTIF